MNKIILAFILTLSFSIAKAQDERVRAHSVAIGAGWANLLDTYLSPFDYKGGNTRITWTTERQVNTFGVKDLEFNTILNADISFIQNPAKNVDEYAGGVRFSLAWLKKVAMFKPGNTTIDLSVGPMISGYLGALYNERNGNNPAQAKADVMIDIAAKARWKFNCFKRNMALQYLIAIPLAGVAFSPAFGQSYYEAFRLGYYDHNIVFANTANMTSARHAIYIDCPVGKLSKTSVRLGYEGVFMQAKFNDIRYHSYVNSIMIGITKLFKQL